MSAYGPPRTRRGAALAAAAAAAATVDNSVAGGAAGATQHAPPVAEKEESSAALAQPTPDWALPHPLDHSVHQTPLDPWSEDSCRDYIVVVCKQRLQRMDPAVVHALYTATVGAAPTPASASRTSARSPFSHGTTAHSPATGVDPAGVVRTLAMNDDEPLPSEVATSNNMMTRSRSRSAARGASTGGQAPAAEPNDDALWSQSVLLATKFLDEVTAKNVVLDRFAVRQLQFCYSMLQYKPQPQEDTTKALTPARAPPLPVQGLSPLAVGSPSGAGMRRDTVLIALRNLYFDLMRQPAPAAIEPATAAAAEVADDSAPTDLDARRRTKAAAVKRVAAPVPDEAPTRRTRAENEVPVVLATVPAADYWKTFLRTPVIQPSHHRRAPDIGAVAMLGTSREVDEAIYNLRSHFALQAAKDAHHRIWGN